MATCLQDDVQAPYPTAIFIIPMDTSLASVFLLYYIVLLVISLLSIKLNISVNQIYNISRQNILLVPFVARFLFNQLAKAFIFLYIQLSVTLKNGSSART